MSDERRAVRVGNCSGFYGDRHSAFAEMVAAGVDVITGDYLAEVTMLVLAKLRNRNPEAGYASSFLKQLTPHLAAIAERGTKVVVNAGGLAPARMAEAVRAAIAQAGVALSVAHIDGDDITSDVPALAQKGALVNLHDGTNIDEWGLSPLTANAYLGAWGIVAALDRGADIIICPRVTDASLVVGAAAWWHRWQRNDYDRIAGAIAAGHIIECGTQATGGNFSGFDPAMVGLPDFPIAEIASDGSSLITLGEGASGIVTPDTVTAQLLYEIQDNNYRNPDAILKLDSIALRAQGDRAVHVGGVLGLPPPARTKVSVTGLGGHRNVALFVLTGAAVEAKAQMVEREVRGRFDGEPVVLRFDLFGRPDPGAADQSTASAILRVAIKGPEQLVGRTFFDALTELSLASYPGLYRLESGARTAANYGDYWPGLIDQALLRHRVHLDDGSMIDIDAPAETAEPSTQAVDETDPTDWPDPVTAPLGAAFNARSGDKGGDANLGLWSASTEGYAWLAQNITVAWLREALPEARDLAIERHLLPNLKAINFVIHGLLGTGATSSLRPDAQAKALGEYALCQAAEIPRALITRDHRYG